MNRMGQYFIIGGEWQMKALNILLSDSTKLLMYPLIPTSNINNIFSAQTGPSKKQITYLSCVDVLTWGVQSFVDNYVVISYFIIFMKIQCFFIRFVIIQDRWDSIKFPKQRSMEDLKERYYNICKILTKVNKFGDYSARGILSLFCS